MHILEEEVLLKMVSVFLFHLVNMKFWHQQVLVIGLKQKILIKVMI